MLLENLSKVGSTMASFVMVNNKEKISPFENTTLGVTDPAKKLRSGALFGPTVLISEVAATITASNARLLLLKLPQEIKNDIYVLVLGGNLVHVGKESLANRFKFSHVVCCATVSEEAAQKTFDKAGPETYRVFENHGRHNACARKDIHQRTTTVNLLHVCRQVYKEAQFIPFSTNTFSFCTSSDLCGFIHHNIEHRANLNLTLRSVHLDLVLSNNKDLHAGWAIALKLLTHEAKLIENVNLNIGIGKIWDEIWTEDPDTKIMAMARVREIVMTLKTLPLKSVTLVLGDQSVRAGLPHWAIDTRWNIHELRGWADEVKHALLGQGKGKAVAGANEFGDLAFRVR